MHAALYDQRWGGYLSGTHCACVEFIKATEPGGELLDAACGTGKYWPLLLSAGHGVYGADQPQGITRVGESRPALEIP